MRALLRYLILLPMLAVSTLQAEENFDLLVEKLADDQYSVRTSAREELLKMCREKPVLIDRLAPIAFDREDDIERVLSVRQIIADTIFVERGSIGFTLNPELIVKQVVMNGPAQKSGIQPGYQLFSVGGEVVKDRKNPDEIYAMIHSTRPGTPMQMEFVTPDGEKLLLQPNPVPRSTIRNDEDVETRKQQIYKEWFEKKGKELQAKAD